jgi:TPR repeat protein
MSHAFVHYLQAAEDGHVGAMLMMGQGVIQNSEEAHKWYKRHL